MADGADCWAEAVGRARKYWMAVSTIWEIQEYRGYKWK